MSEELRSRRVHFSQPKCKPCNYKPNLPTKPLVLLESPLKGQYSLSTSSLSHQNQDLNAGVLFTDEQKIIYISSHNSNEDLTGCSANREIILNGNLSPDHVLTMSRSSVKNESPSYSSSSSATTRNSPSKQTLNTCSDPLQASYRSDADDEELKPEMGSKSPSAEHVMNNWLSMDLEKSQPVSALIHQAKLKKDDDYKETVLLTKENKKVSHSLSDRGQQSSNRRLAANKPRRSLMAKKRKLVDAYVDAIPSSRRQLTMLTVAIDSIWKDVTTVKKGKLTVLEREYKRELAWLRSKKGEQKGAMGSNFLEESVEAARDCIHAYSGVSDVLFDSSTHPRSPTALAYKEPQIKTNRKEKIKF